MNTRIAKQPAADHPVRGNGLMSFRFSRDSALFLSGLSGIAFETIAKGGERPTLLILFGAMVGLPAFLRSDEANRPPPDDTKGGPEKKGPETDA